MEDLFSSGGAFCRQDDVFSYLGFAVCKPIHDQHWVYHFGWSGFKGKMKIVANFSGSFYLIKWFDSFELEVCRDYKKAYVIGDFVETDLHSLF